MNLANKSVFVVCAGEMLVKKSGVGNMFKSCSKTLSKISNKILLCCACLIVTACATNTGPVTIKDVGIQVPDSSPEIISATVSSAIPHTPADSADTTITGPGSVEVIAERPKKVIVQPVAPSKYVPNSPLKIKLIQQSEKRLSTKDYSTAISLAERGLRVDRKEPRFYQVLAGAYNALGNRKQSVYFARQGLRYAPKGSDVYRELSHWNR